MFYLSCLLEIKIIFLEADPSPFEFLAVQLLELRLFFSDAQRILNPAEEHLDLTVFYYPDNYSVVAACLVGRIATDCQRCIQLKLQELRCFWSRRQSFMLSDVISLRFLSLLLCLLLSMFWVRSSAGVFFLVNLLKLFDFWQSDGQMQFGWLCSLSIINRLMVGWGLVRAIESEWVIRFLKLRQCCIVLNILVFY